MAARTRLPLLFPKNLPSFRHRLLVHTEAAAKEPAYPPVVSSLTAKSKAARRRQADEQIKKICASPVEEKLSLLTRNQWKKFVVYPQTFSRDADRWYQHFTKTAYIPGLPEKFTPVAAEKTTGEEGSPSVIGDDVFADIRSVVTHAILQEQWHTKKHKTFLYRHQEMVVGPFLRNLVTGLTYSLAKYNPLLVQSSLGMEHSSTKNNWQINMSCN